jgi:alkanesulfonate monooxygenase SsuD/methylene tetrahydromethanopterin reductase-like flavin-dependent oxidoreductase (luciferase family)
MGGGAQLGIQIRPANTTWPDLREVALLAEEVGFDSIYTWDHLLPVADIDPALPNFEGWQLLAAWGALTTRVRVGMLVTGNTLRHPGLVAKMAVTLDHVTNGRAILGLGAGQLAPEQAQYGLEFPPVRERIARLDEALAVIRTLLSEERTSFEGRFYRLDEAIAEPKPVQERSPSRSPCRSGCRCSSAPPARRCCASPRGTPTSGTAMPRMRRRSRACTESSSRPASSRGAIRARSCAPPAARS